MTECHSVFCSFVIWPACSIKWVVECREDLVFCNAFPKALNSLQLRILHMNENEETYTVAAFQTPLVPPYPSSLSIHSLLLSIEILKKNINPFKAWPRHAAFGYLFVHGWLALHFLVGDWQSVQQASSLKTTTVASGGSSVIDFLLVLAAWAVHQALRTVGCHLSALTTCATWQMWNQELPNGQNMLAGATAIAQ